MKKHIKSFLYEASGLTLIITTAMLFHNLSAGVEGLKYWLMVLGAGFLYVIGAKLIQRGKVC